MNEVIDIEREVRAGDAAINSPARGRTFARSKATPCRFGHLSQAVIARCPVAAPRSAIVWKPLRSNASTTAGDVVRPSPCIPIVNVRIFSGVLKKCSKIGLSVPNVCAQRGVPSRTASSRWPQH